MLGQSHFPVESNFIAGDWESTNIAYEDFARMSTTEHKLAPARRLETPEWAINETKLRELLVAYLEDKATSGKGKFRGTLAERLAQAQQRIRKKCKDLVIILDGLCKEYVAVKRDASNSKRARALEIQIENCDTRLRFEAKDGGAALVVGIVLFYYRMGYNSVETARQLSIKPPHVRQILWRLKKSWKKMQTGHVKPRSRSKIDAQQAAQMRAQGMTYREIADQLGCSGVYYALKKAGLVVPKQKPGLSPADIERPEITPSSYTGPL